MSCDTCDIDDLTLVAHEVGIHEVDTDSHNQPVSIYYEVHRIESKTSSVIQEDSEDTTATRDKASVKVLFIMGFAATGNAWIPLLLQLRRLWANQQGPGLEALLIDNRGMGNSSSPKDRRDYTTTRMAQDALAVLDHLGWQDFHVVGFSMGGMIAIKLASLAQHRVKSLAVLSATGGGHEVLPRTWRSLKYAIKAAMAKTAELRAAIDLKFHFKKVTLQRKLPHLGVSHTVRDLLHAEYVATSRSGRPQPEHAFKGQAHACWNHKVTDTDISNIKLSRCPVWFLHGRHDIVAMPNWSEQLAARFAAPCVLVDGAHFIPRENAVELALLLQSLFTLGHASMAATTACGFNRTSLDGLALQLGHLKTPAAVEANGNGHTNTVHRSEPFTAAMMVGATGKHL